MVYSVELMEFGLKKPYYENNRRDNIHLSCCYWLLFLSM